MTRLERRALGAGTLSLLLLAAALGFQYLGGLAPCPLCLWQRWPHAAAIVLALLVLAWPARGLALVAAFVVLVGAGIGLYHAGIEWGVWPGPASCTAPGNVAAMSAADLVAHLERAPVVRCDDVAWSLLGLSMAAWNALASLVCGLLWLRAYASSSASQ